MNHYSNHLYDKANQYHVHRGISYIYPLFDRFGLIETDPDKGETNGVQMCLQMEEASAHSEAEENTEGEIAR